MPKWAMFFWALGKSFAQYASSGTRMIVGLAVPTKAYVAALTSAGLILARAPSPNAQEHIATHFAHLCALPTGTPLVYRRREGHGWKQYRAVLLGGQTIDGLERLTIKTEEGHSSARYLTPELAQYVNVAATHSTILPRRQTGRDIAGPSPLVSDLLGNDAAGIFARTTRLECVIVGSPGRFLDEISTARLVAVPLYSTSNIVDAPQTGQLGIQPQRADTLQRILRVAQLLPSGAPYRSALLASRAQRSELGEVDNPPLVIFDGVHSFLRTRDDWRQSHWVVILDRTERDFDDAVHAFEQEYIKYRLDKMPPLVIGAIPNGVDIAMFEEVLP